MSRKVKPYLEQPKYVEHKLCHYQQCYNWDCGIASVIMVLSAEQRDFMQKNFIKICQDEGLQQSTWTIDLCYLLKRFSIEHCMYTTVKGVNNRQANYDKIEYQNKNCARQLRRMIGVYSWKTIALKYIQLAKEERKRVEGRFAHADDAGILVHQKELTVDEILLHVETRGPAIVLIDAALLACDLCKHNKLRAEFRRAFGGAYRGHYVVVVGRGGGKILYRDPALDPRLCATSPARLHAARRAPGTDFDAILIFRNYR